MTALRLHEPAPGVLAFYAGRDGSRFAEAPNWVDDGALSLGIASYAIVSGDEALVYDTHVSRANAAEIRRVLEARGVRRIVVVLSHRHLDHIAGTAEFAGCEVIANARTAAHMARDRAAIEAGTLQGMPAIDPLVLPGRVFSGEMEVMVGAVRVRLIEANIHSDDATVLWVAEGGLLFAGDTVEDTVTYVGDPAAFAVHLEDLGRLAALGSRRILPNHGAEAVIAGGGYGPELLAATAEYIRWLMGLRDDPARRDMPLEEVMAGPLARGEVLWFDGYERVHAQNVARSLAQYHG